MIHFTQMLLHSRLIQRLLIAESVIALSFICLVILSGPAKSETFNKIFSQSDPSSSYLVDHSVWDKLLKAYVVRGADGLNRVNYQAFRTGGRADLKSYIDKLQAIDVTKLNRPEQFAFWANLYNAVTIRIILDHYPVQSIRDIDISPGFFSDGPWKKKVVKVNGHSLSLDDIEHNILRKIWKDARVHYAVNCASVGCPNLQTEAFMGQNLNESLDAAAKAFVNSPRGVRIDGDRVVASKIYKWFAEDFGKSEKDVLAHLLRYAALDLAKRLRNDPDIDDYKYDWSLNDIR